MSSDSTAREKIAPGQRLEGFSLLLLLAGWPVTVPLVQSGVFRFTMLLMPGTCPRVLLVYMLCSWSYTVCLFGGIKPLYDNNILGACPFLVYLNRFVVCRGGLVVGASL